MALQKHLDGGVRKPDQAKHDRIAAERIKLVGVGDGKDLFVAETSAVEALGCRGARKRMRVCMSSGNKRYTHVVTDPGILERNQLSNFRVADVQFL